MKRLIPSGIKLIIFFIGIVGIIMIIGMIYYNNQREEIRIAKYDELSAIATLKASQIINYRNERLNDANEIVGGDIFSTAVRRWLKNPKDQNLKGSIIHDLQLTLDLHQYKSVLLVDTSAQVLLSVGYTSSAIGDKTASYLRESLNKKAFTFSDIYHCEHCADTHLDIIVPLFNNGKAICALIFRMDPEQFLYPLIQSWPTPSKTSESLLITKEGNEVVFINKLRHRDNTVLKLRFKIDSSNIRIPAVAATYGIEGLVEGIDYRGIPVLSDARKIPDSPWWMIVKVDLDEVYADTYDNAAIVGLFVGLLILLFASVFFWLWTHQKKTLRLVEAHTKFELQERVITEQERAAEALRIKNWVFDASIAANSIANINGIITEANDSFLRLWGYARKNEVLGKPLYYFIQNREKEDEIITALSNLGKWEGVFTAEKKDGATFLAQSLATVIKNEKGSVIGYQSMVVDITKKREVEDEIKKLNIELEQRVAERTLALEKNTQELKENQAALLNIVEDLNEKTQQLILSKYQADTTNKELESFSYSVSHDLRAPLRALDGFAKILLEDYSSMLNSEGIRYLNIIVENAKNMGQLIDDLLALSRLNRQEMTLTEINMFDLAKSVYEESVQQANVSNIELNMETLPDAFSDYTLLKQVWRNLIGNAIKYGPHKDKLILEIGNRTIDDENIYYIKDNGVGFDMTYKDKLFGVFQRLHSTKEFEGTGVGLAIVQRIIHRLGGRVWAEGQVNKGATFYFTLQNKIN